MARVHHRGMSTAPKTALELAMERLKAQDQEDGVVETPLTDAQKVDIAEARSVAASRIAEREILHRDALAKTWDPESREKAEEEYRVDRERIDRERDDKIARIRKG